MHRLVCVFLAALLLVSSAALLLFSCAPKDAVMRELDVVEGQLREEKPQNALTMLKNFDQERLTGEEQRARFAMLFFEANAKNGVTNAGDEWLVAAEYYCSKRDGRDKMVALVHLAQAYGSAKEYLQCMKVALEAKKLAKDLKDSYYLALVEFELMDVYNESQMYRETLREAKEAVAALQVSQKETRGRQKETVEKLLDRAQFYRAEALMNLGKREEGLKILNEVKTAARKKENRKIVDDCNRLLINYFATSPNETDIDSVLYYSRRIWSHYITENINLLSYFVSKGENEMAEVLLGQKSLFTSSPEIFNRYNFERSRYLFQTGAKDEAFALLAQTYARQDSLHKSLAQRGISSYESDYYLQESLRTKTEAHYERLLFALAGVVLLALGAILFINYRKRMRRKEEELAMSLEIAAGMKRDLLANEQSSTELKTQIGELMRSQFDTLTELCNTYYAMQSNKKIEVGIFKKVKEIILEFKQEEKLAELQGIIDRCSENIVTRLFESLTLSDREKTILLYQMAGFPATTISFLLEVSLSNYYTTKSRLKSKLQTADSELSREILERYF